MGLQCQVYVESSLEHHPLGLVKQQHPREYGGAVGCGGGVLRTSAPTAHHVQQVLDVDDTVAVGITHA